MRAAPKSRLRWLALAALGIAACRADVPLRVISLTPAASELVLELGAGEDLIGVDADSHRDSRFSAFPEVTLEAALRSDVDLVIGAAGSATALAPAVGAAREAPLPSLIELDPHGFEEAFGAAAAIGAALGREAAALRWARELRLELAKISASSLHQPRPRIAVLVNLDPPVLAGGHSFLTELVEIAGAENLTHGTEEREIPTALPALVAAAPALVLIASAEARGAELERALPEARIGQLRFEAWPIEATRFWVKGALPAARALRARVLGLAAPARP